MSPRVLSTGLLAGLLMNVLGWIGNQLWLGDEWSAAVAGSSFATARTRTIWHELASLLPDFVYGLALAWLIARLSRNGAVSSRYAFAVAGALWLVAIATPLLGTANSGFVPWRVTALTLLLALAIMLPVSELIRRRVGGGPPSLSRQPD